MCIDCEICPGFVPRAEDFTVAVGIGTFVRIREEQLDNIHHRIRHFGPRPHPCTWWVYDGRFQPLYYCSEDDGVRFGICGFYSAVIHCTRVVRIASGSLQGSSRCKSTRAMTGCGQLVSDFANASSSLRWPGNSISATIPSQTFWASVQSKGAVLWIRLLEVRQPFGRTLEQHSFVQRHFAGLARALGAPQRQSIGS